MVANPSYEVLIANPDGYESFAAFYPYYLGEVGLCDIANSEKYLS